MAVLSILVWPDARLRTVCAPVSGDVRSFAADMLETMYDAIGRGLAAPQVGVLLRMFVIDVTWKTGILSPLVFVNPQIVWRSEDLIDGPEGCLSLPGLAATVGRSDRLRLRWDDLESNTLEQDFDGFAAICIQHEYDHLDGILTVDHLAPADRADALKSLQ